jgi:surface antigen
MRSSRGGQNALFLGAALSCAGLHLIPDAKAATTTQHVPSETAKLLPSNVIRPHYELLHTVSLKGFTTGAQQVRTTARSRRVATHSYGGISCVPYARAVSGIRISGNAWLWWYHAAGVYARGDQPEVGSILNFRSNGRMPLGHVAVVDRIVNPREIIIEQANWPIDGVGGRIARNIVVVDVSEANNWSAVRVELGHGTKFGSVYPTYGFIYNRPDTGVISASVVRPAPQPAINPVPSDLRPKAERPWHTVVEVAQASAISPQAIDMRMVSATGKP